MEHRGVRGTEVGEAEDSPLPGGLLGSFSNYRDFMGLKEPGWGPFHISQASVAALGSLAWTLDAEPHGCQLRPLGRRLPQQRPLPGWEDGECGQLGEMGKSEDVAIVVRFISSQVHSRGARVSTDALQNALGVQSGAVEQP